jgi:PTS system ascorbate-specific IIA component
MLLRAVCYRGSSLVDVVEKALAGGHQGMMQITTTSVQNQSNKPQGDDHQRTHHQQ